MIQGIMGNLGQQVEDRADTTRLTGKPPASAVPNDLLNLMATQKVAREKDTALKELQMAQQNNPATIKDQLEQKVMGMTQGELTNQTAGILKQRAMQKGQLQQRPQQQQRPQGIQAARPPMGGAPRPMGGAPRPMPQGAGIAGGAPRPPMMASGGIVGYNKGSVVISDAELKKLGLSRQEFDALPAVTKQRLISGKRDDEDPFGFSPSRAQEKRAAVQEKSKEELKALASLPGKFGQFIQDEGKRDAIETAKRYGVTAADLGLDDTSATGTTGTSATGTDTSATGTTGTPATGTTGTSATGTDTSATGTTGTSATGTDTNTAGGVATVLPKMSAMSDTTKELKDTNLNPELRDDQKVGERVSGFFGKENEKTLQDAAKQNIFGQGGVKEKARQAADSRYGIAGMNLAMRDLGRNISAEEKRQLSPEVQRAQRLQAARGAYSQLARTRGEVMDKQNEQRLQFSKDKLERYKDRQKTRIDALKTVDEDVAKSVEAALEFKVNALSTIANLSSAKATDVQQQVDTFLRSNNAEIANKLTAIGFGEEANLRIQLQQIDQVQQLDSLLLDLAKVRQEVKQDYLKAKELEISRLDSTTMEGRDAMAQIDTDANTAAAAVGAKQEKLIHQRLQQLTGISLNVKDLLDGDNTDNIEDLDTEIESQEEQDLLNRNK
jgi:hypothetical protein